LLEYVRYKQQTRQNGYQTISFGVYIDNLMLSWSS